MSTSRRAVASTTEARPAAPVWTETATLAWSPPQMSAPRRTRQLWRITANVVLVIVAVGWFFLLRPVALGGPTTVVRVTGVSMEPGMETGDLAIVHQQDSYEVGDVVAFRVPEAASSQRPHVIHRIVAEHGGVFTLRGDNNPHDDPWDVREHDIAGRLWLHVPGAGALITLVMDPVVLAALSAAVTAFLVCIGPSEPSSRTKEESQ